jgi:hypothetical protein
MQIGDLFLKARIDKESVKNVWKTVEIEKQ